MNTEKAPNTNGQIEVEPKKVALRHAAAYSLMPKDLAEAEHLAEIMCKADIVPQALRGKKENVLIAIGLGAEIGLSPFQAVQSVYVVNGRPSLWGDGLLGVVLQSSKCEYIHETFDDKTMTATCRAKRRGDPEEAVYKFSAEDAKTAGLGRKEGTWQTYPKRMLQMRARGFCVRDKFADVTKGFDIADVLIEDVRQSSEKQQAPAMPEAVDAVIVPPTAAPAVAPAVQDRPLTLDERSTLIQAVKAANLIEPFKKFMAVTFNVDHSSKLLASHLPVIGEWMESNANDL